MSFHILCQYTFKVANLSIVLCGVGEIDGQIMMSDEVVGDVQDMGFLNSQFWPICWLHCCQQ